VVPGVVHLILCRTWNYLFAEDPWRPQEVSQHAQEALEKLPPGDAQRTNLR
jgi:hypothetical protein